MGARNLGECLALQLRALRRAAPTQARAALRICEQPMDLLARRDDQAPGAAVRRRRGAACARAMALIARLEPKPGRRFVDVERNIVVPDVIVRAGRGARLSASRSTPT